MILSIVSTIEIMHIKLIDINPKIRRLFGLNQISVRKVIHNNLIALRGF